jgi:SpoVK/Ycf46/Vps4 family AAA+-type ATPase
MHPYERWITRRYLANALKSKFHARADRPDKHFHAWIGAHRRSLGLSSVKCKAETWRSDSYNSAAAKLKAEWKEWPAAVIESAGEPMPPLSPLQKRVDWLSDACGLNPSQRFLLGLFARIARVPQVRDLAAAVNRQRYQSDRFDYHELRPFFDARVEQRDLSDNGLLVRFGLIGKDDNDDCHLSDLVDKILSKKQLAAPQIHALLLGAPASASLSWDDFAHLGELRDLAARILAHGGDNAAKAANILIYGPPGTGKSEFVKTLAARLGLSAHFVGEDNGDNTEPNRQERIAALMIANALGATGKMIVAVDEADDLFEGVDEDSAATRQGSKVFMNRLVERITAPTIWIVNDISLLDPAVVRRMNLVMRFPKPSLSVRKKMIERIAERAEFRFAASEAAKLARLPAAPALIENAIRSAARIDGSGREAQQILECGLQAMGVREIMAAPAPLAFDPALSSADVNLMDLADRAMTAPTKALSFCLSGPPGTGKSAYARYLAEKLDMEALDKRYSDLISSYLGESEKAIAQAFEEAADMRAFLILDEADSLLRDRGAARHSWEITQVNEMLTWMERHPYPFACTTNAPDLMDQATARRFLFKVRFLPMTSEQIAAAFRRAFTLECPNFVLASKGLTPGDFAVVARKAEVFSERDPLRLGKWLEEEVSAKPDGNRRRIGF